MSTLVGTSRTATALSLVFSGAGVCEGIVPLQTCYDDTFRDFVWRDSGVSDIGIGWVSSTLPSSSLRRLNFKNPDTPFQFKIQVTRAAPDNSNWYTRMVLNPAGTLIYVGDTFGRINTLSTTATGGSFTGGFNTFNAQIGGAVNALSIVPTESSHFVAVGSAIGGVGLFNPSSDSYVGGIVFVSNSRVWNILVDVEARVGFPVSAIKDSNDDDISTKVSRFNFGLTGVSLVDELTLTGSLNPASAIAPVNNTLVVASKGGVLTRIRMAGSFPLPCLPELSG
jgi:hypothetical protein